LAQFVTVRGKKKRKPTDRLIQPATLNRELACLRAMFNRAIKADAPVKNPISKIGAKTLREDNVHTRVLTYEEQTKYLAQATPTLRDVATLILETGARPEEIYRIRPENVHLNEGYFFNPYGKTKAAKRRIKLTSAAKEILTRRLDDCETFLFPCETDSSRPIPKINNAHERALKASKVTPFRPYDCRHTWATRAVESGVDLVTLAAMLGHSKINMVLRAHPGQEHQTNAMNKIEQYVAAQRKAYAAGQGASTEKASGNRAHRKPLMFPAAKVKNR
jgi:integrase